MGPRVPDRIGPLALKRPGEPHPCGSSADPLAVTTSESRSGVSEAARSSGADG